MIRLDPRTDWAALLRQLYADSPHTSRAQLAKAARLNITLLDHYFAGTRKPGRDVLARLMPELGYDLALVPREGA